MTKKMNSLSEIAQLLKQHRQYVITGHINPDGDCVGSMLALGTALRRLGKTVRIITEGPLPESLQSLWNEWEYIHIEDFRFDPADEVLLALDSGDEGRLPKMPDHSLPIVNIDHHLSNSMYGTYNHVDEGAAAAGEIIYRLIQEMGVEIDQQIAQYIAVAIVTDTGNFRYSNTKPETLRMAADFLEMGVNTMEIYRTFIATQSLERIRLKGMVYSRFQTALDGRVAYIVIDQKMLDEIGATLDDAGSISGELRDIRGVEVGFSVLEVEPDIVQLGFRSNSIVPVNQVAIAFGGGGHLRASGAQLEADLHEIPKRIIEKIAEYLE